MPTIVTSAEADRALKERHRAMWALGDYPALAAELIADLGEALVEACRVGPGERVLDVAAGSGNAAIPADLLDAGRTRAARREAQLEWRPADAEALPFSDGEFGTVMSCLGVMFAPHHQASADELVRVCRGGGTIGLLNWTPEGFIGQMFATLKPYVAPPPPGAQPPPLWGREDHVRTLLGDRVTDVTARRQTIGISRFAGPRAFRDYFKTHYGPVIAAHRGIADDPHKVAALDHDLSCLAERHLAGGTAMDWEYLIITARKR
jgi:SAM-dependent methyltransferase